MIKIGSKIASVAVGISILAGSTTALAQNEQPSIESMFGAAAGELSLPKDPSNCTVSNVHEISGDGLAGTMVCEGKTFNVMSWGDLSSKDYKVTATSPITNGSATIFKTIAQTYSDYGPGDYSSTHVYNGSVEQTNPFNKNIISPTEGSGFSVSDLPDGQSLLMNYENDFMGGGEFVPSESMPKAYKKPLRDVGKTLKSMATQIKLNGPK